MPTLDCSSPGVDEPAAEITSATVKYHGKPVTHIDPDGAKDGWIPTTDGGVVVLSEPVGAMTWFPNNNTPRDKATFDMKITVPSKLEVAGSGDLRASGSMMARRPGDGCSPSSRRPTWR